jgi:hypothetical protein
MAEEKAKRSRTRPVYIFRCKSEPIPPGTKWTQKLPRGEEMFIEPSYRKWWLVGGGAVTVALIAGVLIGRFLLP